MRASLLLLVLTAFSPRAARAQISVFAGDTSRTIIAASGQARQTISPDHAVVMLLVEPQAMSVEEASSRLATVERAVLDTLRRLSLPVGAIRTFNSGVAPVRSNMSPMPGGAAFSGRSSIRVELSQLDMLSAVTSAALAKGATSVSAPVYSLAGADSVRQTLIPQAFQQARREAEAMARAAGGRLGRLLEMSSGNAPYNFAEQSQAMVMANVMYDNGQRPNPTTVVTTTVSTRWLLVR